MTFGEFLEEFDINKIYNKKSGINKIKLQHFVLLCFMYFKTYPKEFKISNFNDLSNNFFFPNYIENKIFEIFLDGYSKQSYNSILSRVLNFINISNTNNKTIMKFISKKNELQKNIEYHNDKFDYNYTFENSIFNRSFDSLLAVNIVQDYNDKLLFILNKIIKEVITESFTKASQKTGSTLYGAYDSFSKNPILQTTTQKMTFIFNYIYSLSKIDEKYKISSSKEIEKRRARDKKPENKILKNIPGTFKTIGHEDKRRSAIPKKVLNFKNIRYINNQNWTSGKNDWILKENEYYKNQEKSGKYYIAGSSGTTINFVLFISDKCGFLSEEEKITFLLGIISYLVLGGHHSLDEVAQAFYYDIGQIKHYDSTYKLIQENKTTLESFGSMINQNINKTYEITSLLKVLMAKNKYFKNTLQTTLDDLLEHFCDYYSSEEKKSKQLN
ncbi:hypothetical protein [Fluviispira vulneris]|uniref:hypothetical protein n=1 Tax=Fluviispira vulneris TaxID=2763012 RepID=UPI0016453951|nr:hypothetical protein [Fluviispira vulneris]